MQTNSESISVGASSGEALASLAVGGGGVALASLPVGGGGIALVSLPVGEVE